MQALLRSGRLQLKSAISNPDDPEEREAEEVAHKIMRSPAAFPASHCSCAGGEEMCEECQQKQSSTAIQRSAATQSTPAQIPRIVSDVLRSPGYPLNSATRAFFEPRFGHDFSDVRVHTGPEASSSAHSISAHAYTAGSNIVFASGQYSPDTTAGRALLAHELTHVVQQSGGSEARTSTGPVQPLRVQRHCDPQPCPENEVHVPAVYPLWYFAEKCIQQQYERANSSRRFANLSFNDDWRNMAGRPNRVAEALSCLKKEETPGSGPNFTARSGMFGGEPDIWDFENQTLYEITTRSGTPYRRMKVQWEATLANQICGPADCGGLSDFRPGTWQPPRACFDLPGSLFLKILENDQGVLVYEIVERGAPEEQKEKDKDPDSKDADPGETLPEKLLKLGGELAEAMVADALLGAALELAGVLGAIVASPLLAVAALVLGVIYFWDVIKSLGRKIASVAKWVWGKVTWVFEKIAQLGIKLAELLGWLGGKIAWLAGKLAEGVEWAADKVVSGVKWAGHKIASAAESVWDWLFGSDPEPEPPTIDLPVTETTEHCGTVAHEDTIVRVGADLLFATNESNLKPEADAPLLDAAGKVRSLLRSRDDRVYIEGYTDNVGSVEYNQGLSERRAMAVAEWFVRHRIVPMSMILQNGHGKTEAHSNDPAGRAKDRHVEIWVTKHGSEEKVCW